LRAKNIRDGKLDLSDIHRIDADVSEALPRSQLHKGDVIFTYTGNGYGDCALIPESGRFHLAPNIAKISPEKIDAYFLFRYMKSTEFYQQVENFIVGSSQPTIPMATIRKLLVPDLDEVTQRAIAEMLSSLDDKIDLLTRQNVTLEVLAQTYFRQWFVETETPTERLDSIAKITMGQSPSGESYNEDGQGIVFFQGRAEFGWRYPTIRLYTTSPQRMAQKGDILMSVRAPVGDINIAADDCCIGRGLAAVQSRYPTFTLYALKAQSNQLAVFDGEGTVFGSITKDGLNGLEIHLPDRRRIIEFENKFCMFDDKIKINSEQIQTLQKLRDTLLPKLVSGEVKTKGAIT